MITGGFFISQFRQHTRGSILFAKLVRMVAGPLSAPMPHSAPGGSAGKRLVKHWRVFGPGKWKGQDYTATDSRELAQNYKRFIRPLTSPDPFYTPYASINHEPGTKGLCDGDVIDCGVDPDGWFWVSLLIDPLVATAMDAGKLRQASIEWWDTNKKSDRELSGFPLTPDGQPVGKILCCVSLMGAMPPAVKGQPRPPKSEAYRDDLWFKRFTDSLPRERVTVEIPRMDDSTLMQLKTMFPALTDDQIQQIMAIVGGGDGNPMTPPPDATMGMPLAKFADALADVKKQLAAIQAGTAKAEVDRVKGEIEAAKLEVETFADAFLQERKGTPAEKDRIVADLLKLTPGLQISSVATLRSVHKITGKPATKPDRAFSGNPAESAANPYPAGYERAGRLMAHMPEGAAILAAKRAKASSN